MRESKIEWNVCHYARCKDFIVLKLNSYTMNGIPDRLLITPKGKVIFIEFKSHQGKLTKLQTKFINKLKKYNIDIYVVNNIDFGKKIIDDFV